MTSDRPYRHAPSHEIAAGELRRGAGTLFDPAILQAFIDALDGEWAAATPAASTPAAPPPQPTPQRPCS
jgi:HD-GYP domain-containing protein (c-di-GMP phosphodiesterase class II)